MNNFFAAITMQIRNTIALEASLLRSIFTSNNEYLNSIKEQLKQNNYKTALEIIEKLEAIDKIEIVLASSNFIIRVLKLLGYKLKLITPHIGGYFDPSRNKITILLDLYYYKNKDVFNLSDYDLEILNITIIHEFVHYVASNKPKKFETGFDKFWNKFYTTLADIVDESREYLNDEINYKLLFYMEKNFDYDLRNILKSYFRQPINLKEVKLFNPSVFYLYVFLVNLNSFLSQIHVQRIQYILAETYKRAFGIAEFKFWYLFYQELFVPSEIICVLSETDKYQKEIVKKCIESI
jgi:hypothetical protein